MTVSSLLIFMIVLFLALAIFLGTPIAVALGLAAVAELILQGEVPLMIAAQRIFNGVNSVTLMGIPFFMLVGSIMERSGITQKLIDFANSLVGWLRPPIRRRSARSWSPPWSAAAMTASFPPP